MISLSDQIKEVDREIALRRAVYPKFVQSSKLKQSSADQQMERMVAVRETLVRLKELTTQPEASDGKLI